MLLKISWHKFSLVDLIIYYTFVFVEGWHKTEWCSWFLPLNIWPQKIYMVLCEMQVTQQDVELPHRELGQILLEQPFVDLATIQWKWIKHMKYIRNPYLKSESINCSDFLITLSTQHCLGFLSIPLFHIKSLFITKID